ncbi:hypothetical protein [Actinocorallia populi]|uniref:hypothetical protein n=1 Tax=Actinocorallia populi TaxID=2079200 RepID=UPI000D093E10|nr:hypothetical protein [Actinocorallia populi]
MSIRVERSEVHPSGPVPGRGPAAWHVRLAGLLLVAGPLVWAASFLKKPAMEENEVYDFDMITSVFFLLALFGLASVVLAARATGDRKGRAFPIVPMVLFPFGAASSLGTIPYDTYEEAPAWVLATDPAWPLSQIAMLAAAVAVIRVGRWRGPARWLPLAGALWLVVGMASQIAFGEKVMAYVFTAWMLATYVALGVLFLLRPQAARPS